MPQLLFCLKLLWGGSPKWRSPSSGVSRGSLSIWVHYPLVGKLTFANERGSAGWSPSPLSVGSGGTKKIEENSKAFLLLSTIRWPRVQSFSCKSSEMTSWTSSNKLHNARQFCAVLRKCSQKKKRWLTGQASQGYFKWMHLRMTNARQVAAPVHTYVPQRAHEGGGSTHSFFFFFFFFNLFYYFSPFAVGQSLGQVVSRL